MQALYSADLRAAMLPDEVQALGRYLRKRTNNRRRTNLFTIRLRCAPDKLRKARTIETGLNTACYHLALRRAGEFIALLHFFGWQVYSEDVDAPSLASLFPLSDLTDDLGTDRDDEAPPGFYGGNAGLPFLISWPKDAARQPKTPPRPIKSR